MQKMVRGREGLDGERGKATRRWKRRWRREGRERAIGVVAVELSEEGRVGRDEGKSGMGRNFGRGQESEGRGETVKRQGEIEEKVVLTCRIA